MMDTQGIVNFGVPTSEVEAIKKQIAKVEWQVHDHLRIY